MKKNSIFRHSWILALSVTAVLFFIFGIGLTGAVYAEELDWGKIIGEIVEKRGTRNQNPEQKLDCEIELIFGKNGKFINFSFVLPNVSPDPVISINRLQGAAAEQKNVLKIIDDLHSKIVTVYKLDSSSCPYCTWPFTLPKVATSQENIGSFYIFSKSFDLNTASFDGEAKSTIAFDKKTLIAAWSDDHTDSGVEILDIFLDKENTISPKEVSEGFRQIKNTNELFEILNKWVERIPRLKEVLSILEKHESNE